MSSSVVTQQAVDTTTLASSDIELRLSGGLTNANPALALGDAMSLSDFAVISQTLPFLGNLWNFVPQTDATSGVVAEYRCTYIRNNNKNRTARNSYFWFETLNRDTDIIFSMGLDPAGTNSTAQIIPNERTAPIGVSFSQPNSKQTALFLGDLKPGDYISIWTQRQVSANSQPYYKDNYLYRFKSDVALPSKIIADFGFGAMGDISCDRYNAKINIQNLIARIKDAIPLKSFIPLGNLSFVNDDRCFWDLTKLIDAVINIVFGVKETLGQDQDGDNDDHGFMPQIFQKWCTHYNIKLPFYSYKLFNVHFLHLSTEYPYTAGTPQYNFALDDLQKASVDSNINWIVVAYHQPMYSAGGKGPQGNFDPNTFRDAYHQLFDTYKVDLVLQGHNRNYQRTYPITYGNGPIPTIGDTNLTTYQDPPGEVFIIAGTGGFALDPNDITNNIPSYFAFTDNKDFGYVWFTITQNGSVLTGSFFNVKNNALDQWQISKTIL